MPGTLMANRSVFAFPAAGVRNMFVAVVEPKSKMRAQFGFVVRRTQLATVKSVQGCSNASGKSTCCEPPAMLTAPPI
jgi:hypothetical protein